MNNLSCILHDLGATDHANGDQRFEVDGADAAAEYLRKHDVDDARVKTVWNAIALHTSDGIAHRFGPVEAVAQMGISTDILGRGRELIPADFADKVHAIWPRHDLGYALADVIAQQVHANPAKGSPFSFPGQIHHLYYPTEGPLTWFDFINLAGWNDKSATAGRVGAMTSEALADLFVQYFNARDLDALMSLYERAAAYMPSPGETMTGTDAIAASLKSMMETGATIDLQSRRIHSVGDLAMISNNAEVLGATPDGSPLVTTTAEVVRRQSDGRWLYVIDDPFFSL
ncbi:nuclear transport factor 2 family protein [Nocardia nepalensis]|uniref:nuclear transport factor 2 family protein n=1 Tax=Nocardia nepalensis TaxID=3375448 RepID=UPI003B68452F